MWSHLGLNQGLPDYVFESLLENPNCRALLEHVDVLVDGRFVEALRDEELRFRGSSNQRIIDVAKSLQQGHAVILEEYS